MNDDSGAISILREMHDAYSMVGIDSNPTRPDARPFERQERLERAMEAARRFLAQHDLARGPATNTTS